MNIKGISIVFKKELKDLFRDKKTLFTSILLPLIMFPIIFGLMGRGMDKSTKKVENNVKVAIVENGSSKLGKFLKSQPHITLVDSKNIKKDIGDGKIYLAVEIPDDFEFSIDKEKPAGLKLIYDDASTSSQTALQIISSYIDVYSKEIAKGRLSARGIDISILNPVTTKVEAVSNDKSGIGKLMLSLLLPMMLLIYAMSGPMAAATDLGAGEKERGTLEPLLTTNVSRMNLLFGKLFAITVMGLIGTISSLIGVLIGFKLGGNLFGGDIGFIMPVSSVLMIGIFVLLIVMVFGALELSISIYARSFKEAQTYLSPLTIIGIAAAYGTYMVDVKTISTAYFNIPIANSALIIKEFISGIFNPLHIGITLIWSLFYIVIAVYFAKYMFSREEVIFRT